MYILLILIYNFDVYQDLEPKLQYDYIISKLEA